MIHYITISDFFNSENSVILFDVRAPAEYAKGHIPGARNLPLFTDEERAQVGIIYKSKGKDAAVLLGFDITGTKWRGFIETASALAPDKKVALHCWRGGMRSGAMAWALDFYGFDVLVIKGGYKSYRHWVAKQFAENYNLVVLGGNTGSKKTLVLQALLGLGAQVVDLEELAQHQGSSYGSMNKLVQPPQEQFDNNLAHCLFGMDKEKTVWVEDESRSVGKSIIPVAFWMQMEGAEMVKMDVDLEARVDFLTKEYGSLDKEFLIKATDRIKKRLGLEHAQFAIDAIRNGRMEDFVRTVLVYYDKTYRNCVGGRKPGSVHSVAVDNTDVISCSERLLAFSKMM